MTPYLGFGYFWGFLGLFLNFQNIFWNLLKKLGRVYFLNFGHMSHCLGRREVGKGGNRRTNGRTDERTDRISTPRLRPTPLGWVKNSTSESSNIQITGLIVKCHTILDIRSQDLLFRYFQIWAETKVRWLIAPWHQHALEEMSWLIYTHPYMTSQSTVAWSWHINEQSPWSFSI